jgi:uncharacterized protein YqgV (UPF0045/DUF77 family)
MEVSVELTLTPLQDEFEPPILDFIKALRASKLKVMENPLSTQIYGDYNAVMETLNREIETAFEALDHVVLQIKMVKSDRSDYQPS